MMLFVWHPEIFHKYCLPFLLGVKITRRGTENNAYAKFWGDKQRALWYVMVFSWSGLFFNERNQCVPVILLPHVDTSVVRYLYS